MEKPVPYLEFSLIPTRQAPTLWACFHSGVRHGEQPLGLSLITKGWHEPQGFRRLLCHTEESQAVPPACSPAPSLYLIMERDHWGLGCQNECSLWSLEASGCELGLFSGPQFPCLSSEGVGDPINCKHGPGMQLRVFQPQLGAVLSLACARHLCLSRQVLSRPTR